MNEVWTMKKHEKAQPFVCARCLSKGKSADKVSKNIATNRDGVTICNGCYGWHVANPDERVVP